MKLTMTFFASCLFALALLPHDANADIVWCEDFSSYADGDNPDGAATAVGNGTFDNNGNVFVNANGQLLHTADGGRDTTGIMGASGETCAKFSFDVAFLGDTVDPATDIIFLQMTEAGRSTGANPVPGLAETLDAGQHNISTDAANMSTLCFFANTSGAAVDYVAPDGSTQNLGNNEYTVWNGTSLLFANQTQFTNGTAPTGAGLSSLYMNTFNGQEGESWVFDNFKMEDFAHVPEPTSGLILVGFGLMAFSRRKRV